MVGSGERLSYVHFCVFPLRVSFATLCVAPFIYFFKLKTPMSSKMKTQTNRISMYSVVACDDQVVRTHW